MRGKQTLTMCSNLFPLKLSGLLCLSLLACLVVALAICRRTGHVAYGDAFVNPEPLLALSITHRPGKHTWMSDRAHCSFAQAFAAVYTRFVQVHNLQQADVVLADVATLFAKAHKQYRLCCVIPQETRHRVFFGLGGNSQQSVGGLRSVAYTHPQHLQVLIAILDACGATLSQPPMLLPADAVINAALFATVQSVFAIENFSDPSVREARFAPGFVPCVYSCEDMDHVMLRRTLPWVRVEDVDLATRVPGLQARFPVFKCAAIIVAFAARHSRPSEQLRWLCEQYLDVASSSLALTNWLTAYLQPHPDAVHVLRRHNAMLARRKGVVLQ